MTSSARPTLRLDGLVKRFGGVVAVNNISVSAYPSQILGIIGQNGAGKTSLFNTIAGTYMSNEGSIVFNDVDITRMPTWKRSRRGIARTFQIPRPIMGLTVRENIELGSVAHGHSKAVARANADAALEEFHLKDCAFLSPGELSTGQLRLLEFARAASLKPSLLLLDEIFAGLSSDELAATAGVVRNLRKSGIAIVWIEHNVRLMMELADAILVMDQGKMIAHGTPAEVSTDPRVREVYLGTRHVKGKS